MAFDQNTVMFTVDVEDWFQVENLRQAVPLSSWLSYELRIEKNTHRLLDLLDSHDAGRTKDERQGLKRRATFFVLGWIAEHLPHLVREIHARSHEVASHGYYHRLCVDLPANELKKDVMSSKMLLEDTIGAQVLGYRAPSFTITPDVLKVVEECGYLYDSSFNSFSLHGRYGRLDLSENTKKGTASKISDSFYELPISNLKLKGQSIPWGGGGYFRLIPLGIFQIGAEIILKKEGAYLFYIHPWEIDAGQPRLNGIRSVKKFRHYVNLDKTEEKLLRLLRNWSQNNFVTCEQYLRRSEAG